MDRWVDMFILFSAGLAIGLGIGAIVEVAKKSFNRNQGGQGAKRNIKTCVQTLL